MLYSLRFTNGPAISKLECYVPRFELTIKTENTLFSEVRYVLKTKKYFPITLISRDYEIRVKLMTLHFFTCKPGQMYEIDCTAILQDIISTIRKYSSVKAIGLS